MSIRTTTVDLTGQTDSQVVAVVSMLISHSSGQRPKQPSSLSL